MRTLRQIYLDYNATTPIAPEVCDAIEPFLREHFGNQLDKLAAKGFMELEAVNVAGSAEKSAQAVKTYNIGSIDTATFN